MTASIHRTALVGKLFHESHGFSPIKTGPSEFDVVEGEDLIVRASTSRTTLSGICSSLRNNNVRLHPVLSATAPPGGLVDHQFYLRLMDRFLAEAEKTQPDIIALELHGALSTDETTDAEGDLLRALRQVSPQSIIAVGLDLHAHVTEQMLCSADICIACKNNPHSDLYECGERVGDLAFEALTEKFEPITSAGKVRMLMIGGLNTSHRPLRDLHDMARDMMRRLSEIRDISIYNPYRFIDAEGLGQTVTILSDGFNPTHLDLIDSLNEFAWRHRSEFVDDLASVDDMLSLAEVRWSTRQNPLILADMGDRVLAGAPGDSTQILRQALDRFSTTPGLHIVTDPETVQHAVDAGPGARMEVSLGGKITPIFSPLVVDAEVSSIHDGLFTIRGPYQEGESGHMGKTAVLQLGGLQTVVVTTLPAFSHDPNAYLSLGLSLSNYAYIVVKSGSHFALNYADIGDPAYVSTPGLGKYDPSSMDRHRSRIWPEHQVDNDPYFDTCIFHGRSVSRIIRGAAATVGTASVVEMTHARANG